MRRTAVPKPGSDRESYRDVSPDDLPPGVLRRVTHDYRGEFKTITDERTPGWERVAERWPKEIR